MGTIRTNVTPSATYQQVLDNVRRLSPEEQLALVADIATVLREAVRSEDEVAETAYLAESPILPAARRAWSEAGSGG